MGLKGLTIIGKLAVTTTDIFHCTSLGLTSGVTGLSVCGVFLQMKPMGSTFIGTSPEFEVALYTIVFLCARSSVVDLNVATYEVIITCYKHGLNLGTSYPKAYDP